jgi:probable HAF family extracellular repeat protein
MKTFKLLFIGSTLLFTLSCDQNMDLARPRSDMENTLTGRSQNDFPPLNPDFSRGLGINNAGAMVGSVRNSTGQVHAFKLTKHDEWLSDEEVSPNGLPEIRFSINDRGDVAGHKVVTGGISPVVWKDDGAFDLQVLPGYQFGEVYDINACGQMVGECLNGNYITPTAMRATVFSLDGDPVDLGTLGGTKASAAGINDEGDIVGVAENAIGQLRAFLYKDGVMTDIGTLGGTTANANAINNSGQIAGRSLLANGAIRGFLYSEGVMTDLGTLGGAASVAFDINDRGEVVGFSRISNGQAHAFLYKDGVMTDLGALGGIDSRAISINNRGDIIGHYTLANGSVHAFLYTDGEMIPL